MSLLNKIKDQVAADIGHEDWNTLARCETMATQIYVYEKRVTPLYATAVAQDALNRASHNAEVVLDGQEHITAAWVDKDSIVNTPINLL